MTQVGTTTVDERSPYLPQGVRYYLFFGLAGLIVLWLMLMEKFGIFAIIPVLVGAMGMAGYLVPPTLGVVSRVLRKPKTLMPVLVLVSVVLFEIAFGNPPWKAEAGLLRLDDLLIVPAMLAYLASQYRLFSLGTAAVPPDLRPRPDRLGGDEPDPRPARLATSTELMWLSGTIVCCVLGGQLLWWMVSAEWRVSGSDEPPRMFLAMTWWRLLTLVWMLGIGTIVLTGLFRTMRAYRQSADEARMILQDAMWEESRGEQRRSARWMAWTRRQVERQRETQT